MTFACVIARADLGKQSLVAGKPYTNLQLLLPIMLRSHTDAFPMLDLCEQYRCIN